MNTTKAQIIIETLRKYSEETKQVAHDLEKYDYRDEAAHWYDEYDPSLIEAAHPTLRDLHNRLAKYITTNPYSNDNISRDEHLSKTNLESVINYLQVSRDTLLAVKVGSIAIEPMQAVADAFKTLNLLTEYRRFNNICEFAHGIRQWYRASKNNHGTTIVINTQFNYDEATPAELAADAGYKMFARLFKPSCNYTTAQKRNLYNSLKQLYTSDIDAKEADKTVMAVILLFRQDKQYKAPFSANKIGKCKEIAMASLSRNCKTIKSYSESSLTDDPRLGQDHVKRAESLIKHALENTK